MTKTLKLCMVAGGVAATVLGVNPALAAGTASGTSVTNTATVDYNVGAVAQTQISANVAFVVDRKINLTVTEAAPGTTTGVAPNQTGAATTFVVRNESNATIDIGLTAAQLAGGTAAHGGTDNFDVTSFAMYNDTNGNGSYDAGTDLAITYIDELAADTQRTIFVVGNIPSARVNGDVAGVTLTGQARASGVTGTQGAVLTETAGANTAGVDTVFADGVGLSGDIARDGRHSDDDDFTVQAPVLTVAKQSRIVSDPFNNTTNPKMIPGATVEYCIVVANGSGGSAASGVTVRDIMPTQTLYDSAYGIFLNGTYTGTPGTGTCNLDGTAGGAYNGGTTEVSGTLGTINAGTTRTLYFRVTIQ